MPDDSAKSDPFDNLRAFMAAYGLDAYTDQAVDRIRQGWDVEDVISEIAEAAQIDAMLAWLAFQWSQTSH